MLNAWRANNELQDEIRESELPLPRNEKQAHLAQEARLTEAIRARDQVLPRVLKLQATTPVGVIMKARVIATLFTGQREIKGEAVASLVDDQVAVFGSGVNVPPSDAPSEEVE